MLHPRKILLNLWSESREFSRGKKSPFRATISWIPYLSRNFAIETIFYWTLLFDSYRKFQFFQNTTRIVTFSEKNSLRQPSFWAIYSPNNQKDAEL